MSDTPAAPAPAAPESDSLDEADLADLDDGIAPADDEDVSVAQRAAATLEEKKQAALEEEKRRRVVEGLLSAQGGYTLTALGVEGHWVSGVSRALLAGIQQSRLPRYLPTAPALMVGFRNQPHAIAPPMYIYSAKYPFYENTVFPARCSRRQRQTIPGDGPAPFHPKPLAAQHADGMVWSLLEVGVELQLRETYKTLTASTHQKPPAAMRLWHWGYYIRNYKHVWASFTDEKNPMTWPPAQDAERCNKLWMYFGHNVIRLTSDESDGVQQGRIFPLFASGLNNSMAQLHKIAECLGFERAAREKNAPYAVLFMVYMICMQFWLFCNNRFLSRCAEPGEAQFPTHMPAALFIFSIAKDLPKGKPMRLKVPETLDGAALVHVARAASLRDFLFTVLTTPRVVAQLGPVLCTAGMQSLASYNDLVLRFFKDHVAGNRGKSLIARHFSMHQCSELVSWTNKNMMELKDGQLVPAVEIKYLQYPSGDNKTLNTASTDINPKHKELTAIFPSFMSHLFLAPRSPILSCDPALTQIGTVCQQETTLIRWTMKQLKQQHTGRSRAAWYTAVASLARDQDLENMKKVVNDYCTAGPSEGQELLALCTDARAQLTAHVIQVMQVLPFLIVSGVQGFGVGMHEVFRKAEFAYARYTSHTLLRKVDKSTLLPLPSSISTLATLPRSYDPVPPVPGAHRYTCYVTREPDPTAPACYLVRYIREYEYNAVQAVAADLYPRWKQGDKPPSPVRVRWFQLDSCALNGVGDHHILSVSWEEFAHQFTRAKKVARADVVRVVRAALAACDAAEVRITSRCWLAWEHFGADEQPTPSSIEGPLALKYHLYTFLSHFVNGDERVLLRWYFAMVGDTWAISCYTELQASARLVFDEAMQHLFACDFLIPTLVSDALSGIVDRAQHHAPTPKLVNCIQIAENPLHVEFGSATHPPRRGLTFLGMQLISTPYNHDTQHQTSSVHLSAAIMATLHQAPVNLTGDLADPAFTVTVRPTPYLLELIGTDSARLRSVLEKLGWNGAGFTVPLTQLLAIVVALFGRLVLDTVSSLLDFLAPVNLVQSPAGKHWAEDCLCVNEYDDFRTARYTLDRLVDQMEQRFARFMLETNALASTSQTNESFKTWARQQLPTLEALRSWVDGAHRAGPQADRVRELYKRAVNALQSTGIDSGSRVKPGSTREMALHLLRTNPSTVLRQPGQFLQKLFVSMAAETGVVKVDVLVREMLHGLRSSNADIEQQFAAFVAGNKDAVILPYFQPPTRSVAGRPVSHSIASTTRLAPSPVASNANTAPRASASAAARPTASTTPSRSLESAASVPDAKRPRLASEL